MFLLTGQYVDIIRILLGLGARDLSGGRKGGRGGAKEGIHPGRHCAGGGIWRGKNMELWNLATSGELVFALQDGFSGFVSIAGFSSWEMKYQLQHSS